MKTLDEFLLTEIGDSRKAFPFKIHFGHTFDDITAKFSSKHGQYEVFFWQRVENKASKEHKYEVGFEGHNSEFLTNYGISDAFRIMATMIEIVKEVVKRFPDEFEGHEITSISFKSSRHGKRGTDTEFGNTKKSKQRMKLYNAFVKNALRGTNLSAKISSHATVIDIK